MYQNCGRKDWWTGKLPSNVTIYPTINELKNSDSKGYLIVTDQIVDNILLENAVVYTLGYYKRNYQGWFDELRD